MHHPPTLKGDGVDTAGDDEIVADRDAVAALFGCPLADPPSPGAITSEAHGDFSVVGRQVVLGEKVHDHGRFGNLIKLGIRRSPVLATQQGEVAPPVPRNVIVRIPGLRLLKVSVQVGLYHWFQLGEQCLLGCRHRDSPSLTYGCVTYATVGLRKIKGRSTARESHARRVREFKLTE